MVFIAGIDNIIAGDSNEISNSDIEKSVNNFVPDIFNKQPTVDNLKRINAFFFQPKEKCSEEEIEAFREKFSGLSMQSNLDYDDESEVEKIVNPVQNKQKMSKIQKEEQEVDENDEAKEFESSIREFFPDVWMYDSFIANESAINKTYRLPDSMTSWKISGFSLHPEHGIAIGIPQYVEVSKDYFIVVHSANVARVGEVLLVTLSVQTKKAFKNSQVEVTSTNYKHDKDFKILRERSQNPKTRCQRYTQLREDPIIINALNDTQSIFVNALKSGEISLNFKLKVDGEIVDEVISNITILPKGIVKEENHQLFVDLINERNTTRNVTINLPKKAVLIKAELVVGGNLLGPALNDLNEL